MISLTFQITKRSNIDIYEEGGMDMAVAGFSLFVVGIILMISYSVSKRKNSRCSAQTQGTLERITETENSSGSTGLSFTYSYYVNGIEYKHRTKVYTEANGIGDTCTIWYNPKKPKEAQAFHYESTKTYKVILICGIVSIIVGIVLCVIGL